MKLVQLALVYGLGGTETVNLFVESGSCLDDARTLARNLRGNFTIGLFNMEGGGYMLFHSRKPSRLGARARTGAPS